MNIFSFLLCSCGEGFGSLFVKDRSFCCFQDTVRSSIEVRFLLFQGSRGPVKGVFEGSREGGCRHWKDTFQWRQNWWGGKSGGEYLEVEVAVRHRNGHGDIRLWARWHTLIVLLSESQPKKNKYFWGTVRKIYCEKKLFNYDKCGSHEKSGVKKSFSVIYKSGFCEFRRVRKSLSLIQKSGFCDISRVRQGSVSSQKSTFSQTKGLFTLILISWAIMDVCSSSLPPLRLTTSQT